MPIAFSTLDTPRLRLRAPRPDDARTLFERYARDPEVSRYMIWRPHQAVDEMRDFLATCMQGLEAGDRLPWVLESRADGRAMGMLDVVLEGFSAHFGYVLARDAWGQGLMTEALSHVLPYLFTDPGLYRVWAIHDVDNPASGRVMEKAGMQREGLLRRSALHPNISPEPRDSYLYAITR